LRERQIESETRPSDDLGQGRLLLRKRVPFGWRDEDRKPMRVGSLERVKPTLLLIETPKHRRNGQPRVRRAEVHGRKRGPGPVKAGGESALEG
jgi:hypothetical protein